MCEKINIFGLLLRNARQNAHLSRTALFLRSGYQPASIYTVERGLRDPSILAAVNLAVGTYTRPGPFFAALAQAMKGEAIMPPEPDWTLPPLLFPARHRPSPFGLLLAQCRKAMAGPSQQILADRSGYTQRNLSKVEHGRQEPSTMTGVSMVLHAGLDVEAFFDELYMRLISVCAPGAGKT